MAGFVELTDAIGGVPVCLNEPVRDSYSGVNLPAGPQVVSGAGALAFVRQRHGLADGDLDRIARQQAFAAGLARRLMTAGTLTDPAALQRLVGVVTRHVVLDDGWDLDQAVGQIGRLSGDDLTFRTIPTGRPDLRTPYDGIAVQVDPDEVRAFVQAAFAPPGSPAATPAPSAAPRTNAPDGPVTVEPAGTPFSPTPTRTPTPTPATGPPPVISAGGQTCVN
ncbi:hypothetical protein BJF78_31210 [Pseudonocardia sp. CNS-139]|nr:hypothetical protein BJF78_31210 [Pseudonocardia sp. CNS-139]